MARNNNTWKGAICVVTGAGSGIGRALSLELAKRGALVVVTDVNRPAAEAVAREIGGQAKASGLDVRDAQEVRRVIDGVAAEHGRLDLLVNNAGIAVTGEVQDLSLAHWERILDINVRGVIHGVHAAYPIMVRQGAGHIVNVASAAGLAPVPLGVPYSMTKHAVVGLSRSLRIEAAALGVRVSVLCPTAIETPILESGNPPDLPSVPWHPNVRRFLTRLAGPPYPVEGFAQKALDAIERNEAVVVIPGRARFVRRIDQLFPSLTERLSRAAVAEERSTRGC
jgi:NAD(P)-dependent dehydrogenase (short-subunit alcohol dehydrogenase family)